MNFHAKVALCLPLIFAPLAAQSEPVSLVSRYATTPNKPTVAQINPLLALKEVRFPVSVQTIGDAVDYWLMYSGYKLVPQAKQSSELQVILKQPLPQVLRDLGVVTTSDGLEILVGKTVFRLTQDPVHREVNFKLLQNTQRKKQGE